MTALNEAGGDAEKMRVAFDERRREIVRRLNMDKSTVSRNLRLMREKGWLDVETEGSGRGHALALTEKGKALVEESVSAWNEAQTRAKAMLGQRGAASIHSVANSVWSHIGRV